MKTYRIYTRTGKYREVKGEAVLTTDSGVSVIYFEKAANNNCVAAVVPANLFIIEQTQPSAISGVNK